MTVFQGVVLSLVLMIVSGQAETASVLDDYISEGLQHNLGRQQAYFSYHKSVKALDEARGMFYPSFDLQARYSRAGGGRTIEFPIGDLLNPVYGTLNQILAAQGQEPRFPEDLANEEIALVREEEQETKVELVQPLFQPALYHNLQVRKLAISFEQAGCDLYSRRLIRDIKSAYFNYLKAECIVELLEKTRIVLEENRRISERLYSSDKVTRDVVFRSEAELSQFEHQVAEAEKACDMARAYFNHLLNRPLDEAIERVRDDELSFGQQIQADQILGRAMDKREEIVQLEQAIDIARRVVKIEASPNYPNLLGIVDYGFEGEDYRFTDEDDFWIASLVLRWNLFHGFQDRSRQQQARLDAARLSLSLVELKNKIALQVKEALAGLEVARRSITSTADWSTSAQQSFDIISRRYEAGMVSQLEFLDTRRMKTDAEINHIIARYDYQIRLAELEQVSALIDLAQYAVLTSGEATNHD